MELGRALGYAAGATGIVAIAVLVVGRGMTPARRTIAAVHNFGAAPESVHDAGVYQLIRMRHDAIESMRADLLKIVATEARFTADSGHPTNTLYPPYWPGTRPDNTLGFIRVTPHGWWTSISNIHTTAWCEVAVGHDTSIANAPSGVPVCHAR